MRLMAAGKTPSVGDVLEAAEVSRRTIYMYFPSFEQLLLDATVGLLSADTVDPVAAAPPSDDIASRVEQLSRAVNGMGEKTMHLGRALVRLTVEGSEPQGGGPKRGYRRIEWIERTLEPLRGKLSRKEFERLVSALSVVMGWEALIALADVRRLGHRESVEVLAFAARAIVDAALRRP